MRDTDRRGILGAVAEPKRLALHRAAHAALGEEEGYILLALNPPANTDMATKEAVGRTAERLSARIAQFDAKIDAAIEASALRTRLWMFGIVAAWQIASVSYLRNVLG